MTDMTHDGDGHNDHDDNGWDSFDWDAVGDGISSDERGSGEEGDDLLGADEQDSGEGEWVSQGGVLHWEEPEGASEDIATDLRREAHSPWAAETITLPLGAPDALRVRAVRAWLARQRMLENEAMGILLLERRQQTGQRAGREHEDAEKRRPQTAGDDSPLDVALAEHQAAVAEYESLLAALDEVGMHNGPGRVLVEYHFLLGDRIAALAILPEAPADFAETELFMMAERAPSSTPVTPRSRAEWEGRATAVRQARRRVERVTAPEEEE
jgi:hypothetical protein